MEAFFLAKGSFNNYVEKTKYRYRCSVERTQENKYSQTW